jgi:hypothetical protein
MTRDRQDVAGTNAGAWGIPNRFAEIPLHQTEKRPDRVDFGDSGKTAYFAVRIENEGKKGPWGPLVSALIP